MTIKQIAIKCFQDEASTILDLIPQLDNNLEKSINLIKQCKGKLIISGVGKSGHIGAKIAATLASTGTPSFFVNPLDAYHGDLGMFTPKDIVLAISYSGNTDELLRLIPLLLERHIPIIGMSGNPHSLLAQYSDYHLNIAVKQEACPLNLAPTSSTTATLAMGDAIACALIKVKDFKANDFAQFHPGGSLGKRLLTRVKDAMLSHNLPVVSLNCKVCDALIKISELKTGLVVVINECNKIQGIVTDGDVRRIMQIHQNTSFFNIKVSDIMVTSPKTIHEESKLSEAEIIMRNYNIHSLLVVNDNNELVGIIDSFHCL